MNILVLDIEIAKLPFTEDKPRIEGIDYCEGWRDFENMGIAYVGLWCEEKGYFYYHGSQKNQIEKAIEKAERIITFNGNAFDRNLLIANDINCPETYDLLEEIRVASGQPRYYDKELTRGGYSLSAIAKANNLEDKKGDGNQAAIWYQQGDLERLIKYLKHDLYLTRELFDRRNNLIDPTNGEQLNIYIPEDLIV